MGHGLGEEDVLQLISLPGAQIGKAGAALADRHPAQEFTGDRFRGQNLQGQPSRPALPFLAEDVHFAGTGLGAEMPLDAPTGEPAQAEVDYFPDVAGMVDQAAFIEVESLVLPAFVRNIEYRANVDWF